MFCETVLIVIPYVYPYGDGICMAGLLGNTSLIFCRVIELSIRGMSSVCGSVLGKFILAGAFDECGYCRVLICDQCSSFCIEE